MGRVDEVLDAVGLTDAADRRVKGYSMGMRQRLAIAAALLGDPEVLILDEPTNGLDPPGISWMRRLLREQAANGRAVLVSSHLLAEVAQSVDDVVVIANGELRGHGTLEEVLGGDEGDRHRGARAGPRAAGGRARAARPPGRARRRRAARARRDARRRSASIALEAQVALIGLAPRTRSLETAFFALTGGRAMSAAAAAPSCSSCARRGRSSRSSAVTLALSLLVVVPQHASSTDDFTEQRRPRAVHRRLHRASSSCCSA